MEKVLFKSEEPKKTSEAAAVLRTIADKIEQGEITFSRGAEEVQLAIPQNLVLEIKVESETKAGRPGEKKSLEIELEWREGQPGDDTGTGGEVAVS